MKKERWYVSVLHLRGRNESRLVSTEVLVSLDGIIGCGRTSFETVIMLFTALKKNIMSRYSYQLVIGSKSKEINLS
jgi:hypothetical protein